MPVIHPDSIYDFVEGGFSAAELDRLEQVCDRLDLAKSSLTSLTGQYYDDNLRKADVAAIPLVDENMWIAERLAAIVSTINSRAFAFDLRGFSEAPQYMVYRDSMAGHFNWHMDVGPRPVRKLSLTLQLSDPSRYEGCDLQFSTGSQILTAPRERGAAVAFPSYVVHRISPITSGIRKAVVAWISGPDFR